ncbi:Integrase core domain [Popillia japonica]|uniref:Integrase core domain n=1 Tax=Popillia japonica TaxID=7064 RepID=A0AAW1IWJ8_POPJA
MQPEIADHVRCCRICNAYKRGAHQTPAPLRPHAPAGPFEVISVDVVGPMTATRTGNRFAIVAQDLYSRWIEAKAVKKATTTATVEFLEESFQRFGYPRAILSDNGPQFMSIAWGSCATKMAMSSMDHPHIPPKGQPGRTELKKGQHFSPKWIGPYPVVELAGPTAVWVERPGALRAKYHLDQVRRARRPATPPQPQQPPPDEAEPKQPPPDEAETQQPPPDETEPQQPPSTPEPTPGPSWTHD